MSNSCFFLVRLIEVIGEAASRVSGGFQEQAPAIPWAEIISTRNRLIHAYFNINLNLLWDTVMSDLPPLIVELERIIGLEENQGKLF